MGDLSRKRDLAWTVGVLGAAVTIVVALAMSAAPGGPGLQSEAEAYANLDAMETAIGAVAHEAFGDHAAVWSREVRSGCSLFQASSGVYSELAISGSPPFEAARVSLGTALDAAGGEILDVDESFHLAQFDLPSRPDGEAYFWMKWDDGLITFSASICHDGDTGS